MILIASGMILIATSVCLDSKTEIEVRARFFAIMAVLVLVL
jgi:hypothetical protein